ncbi:MAG: AMP-binding protein [Pseudomonadota bacterium]
MPASLKAQIERNAWASMSGLDVPWILQQWAEKTPDKDCVIWCPFEGDVRRISYAELFAGSRRLAAGLKDQGVGQGDFVLLHMDNSPEFVFSWYACAILGAVAVSTNTRCVARDLSYFAEVTGAVCALTQPKYAELIREACTQIGFLAIADNDAGAPRQDFATLLVEQNGVAFPELFAEQGLALRSADPRQDLSVQFTSGTTSRPKAVLWTHANGIWAGRSCAQNYRLRQTDVTNVFLPLFHTNAQSYSMLSTHWSGGTIVLQPKFSASRYWQVVMEHGVTWTSMIPFAIKAISNQPVPRHSMRFWSLGARIQAIEEQFNVSTIGLWGMTETLTHGTIADMDHLGPELTIGRVARGYEIQLRRSDGSPTEAGEAGHLFIRGVRGVSLFKEYYRDVGANAAAFDDDGWFDTGDLIRPDESGWLYFTDRDKDMLKVGVENDAASEIESVIMMTGLVEECAVVGQAHYMLDEVPVAFVIPGPEAESMAPQQVKERLLTYCRKKLPDFKVIRDVHVVDELPRSTLEKIAKNVLRERLPTIKAETRPA